MPEPTPYLYAANTPLHKEVRNQPERRGRTVVNAPCAVLDASGQKHVVPAVPSRDDLRERPDRYGPGAGRDPADAPVRGRLRGARGARGWPGLDGATSPAGDTPPGTGRRG
ncbi:hypothetical protein GCM10009535_32490 [Streptomyces thermocarboxydovorans]|uniref:Uncharacterized protein n=1 Tax=Streptomyces thermocarboxydovorans TaxID=59298 RepID=A0ABN1HI98_9ACTN